MIEGNSYRMRQHADLVPEALRARPIHPQPPPASAARRRGRPPKERDADHAGG